MSLFLRIGIHAQQPLLIAVLLTVKLFAHVRESEENTKLGQRGTNCIQVSKVHLLWQAVL